MMQIPFDELRQKIVNNAVTDIRLRSLLDEPDRTDENIAAVIASLLENTSVEYLDFDGVPLKSQHILAIAQLLERNTTLKVLYLMDQPIDVEGIQQLTSALAVNTGLEDLCLSGVSLGDTGIRALADALTQNRHLTELNINCCRFTTESVKIFCDTLAGRNNTLRELRLVGPFDIPALKALTTLLQASGIKTLYMGSPLNHREPERVDVLCELIRTAPLDELIIVGKGNVSYEDTQPLRHHFLTALIENTTLTAVEMGFCVLSKFEWLLVKRNREIAVNPEQKDTICKKYRSELENLLTKLTAKIPYDNSASHWHHPNHVQVNGTKANGNENNDHKVTSN